VSATTIAKSPANFRFWILWLGAESVPNLSKGQILGCRLTEKEADHRIEDFLFTLFSQKPKPVVSNVEPSAMQNHLTLFDFV
jgi:hypothetical protein